MSKFDKLKKQVESQKLNTVESLYGIPDEQSNVEDNADAEIPQTVKPSNRQDAKPVESTANRQTVKPSRKAKTNLGLAEEFKEETNIESKEKLTIYITSETKKKIMYIQQLWYFKKNRKLTATELVEDGIVFYLDKLYAEIKNDVPSDPFNS